MAEIIRYTKTDEAPALATYSLLPIVKRFTRSSDIEIELQDISLAARILAVFPEFLTEEQQVSDALATLGELAKKPEANIIKLPNISASMPQLETAIEELRHKGYRIPRYPHEVTNEAEKDIKARYDKIKGSAVNPVLREGNSDRRVPKAVKNFAKKNPHSMGAWSADSKSYVATMNSGDFRHNEASVCSPYATQLNIELVGSDGNRLVLKEGLAIQEGEICDMTFMSKAELITFLSEQIEDADAKELLFSLHMKATMMKVSDPIIFGYAVKAFFAPVFSEFGDRLEAIGVDVNNGLGDLLSKVGELPATEKDAILNAVKACIERGPKLAMVNSDKGITNLHVPSDVIVDASMPAMIRNSGKMWDKEGKLQDTLAVIPDSSYASIYEATIAFCKVHGAFDPSTMGTVSNVGLMAQKAEEYGSHDKTFEIPFTGNVQVTDDQGTIWSDQKVEAGDIWRMCQVKDAPIKDWVKLAVQRARATGWPAVFWLDEERAHDAELLKKVRTYLQDHDTSNLEIHIMSPLDATNYSLERIKAGLDTISVTGNVLRDYLTDLFPILELGTSAKMLSIVPLMDGGGLFETGAGGSAPKHVQQFISDDYLRWDSLGEFLALGVSLEFLSEHSNNTKAMILSKTLDQATEKLLENNKSPQRRLGSIDNRGSHYYLALYWSEALANQEEDQNLKEEFASLYRALSEHETQIMEELNSVQGHAVNIQGYYLPDETLTTQAMRPSSLLNGIIG